MAWIDIKNREPPVAGEYRVVRAGTGQSGGYESECAYEPPWPGAKRHKSGFWYSMVSGNRVYNVQTWWEDSDG